MTRRPRLLLVLLLSSGLGGLVGCASVPVQIDAPPASEPYAILQFSRAIQLIAFNDQAIDPSQPIRTLRVRPGLHTLRFMHLNDGPEGSAAHAGQQADPFTLAVHEGITYAFEAKTWGIIWRPEVAEYSAIPDYCLTHACENVAAYLLQQRLQTADCNWIPPGNPGICKEDMMSEKADFRQFYRDAHAAPNLSEREKIFMGLAVAFTRNCQPWVERRLADARKAGIDEYDLDCAVDVIAAVDAGILQSLNIRSKAQLKRNADDRDRWNQNPDSRIQSGDDRRKIERRGFVPLARGYSARPCTLLRAGRRGKTMAVPRCGLPAVACTQWWLASLVVSNPSIGRRIMTIPMPWRRVRWASISATTNWPKSSQRKIFGFNSACLHNLNLRADYPPLTRDKFAQIKQDYRTAGLLDTLRDNATHGFIAKRA